MAMTNTRKRQERAITGIVEEVLVTQTARKMKAFQKR